MRIVRVVSIVLVTLIHIQPGRNDIAGSPELVRVVRFVGGGILASASVPVLSIISGYLFFAVASSRPYGTYVKQRMKSLLLPLAAWSALTALLLIGMEAVGLRSSLYERLMSMPLLDSIFGLRVRPINYPLYFLRDMFAISLISPIMLWMAKRYPLVLMAITLCMYYLDIGWPVVIRPMTLVFFSLGLTLYSLRTNLAKLDKLAPVALLVALIFWSVWTYYQLYSGEVDNPYYSAKTPELLNRLLVALLMWTGSGYLLRKVPSTTIDFLEERIFVVFLSHLIVITIVGGVFSVAFGGYATHAYLGLMVVIPPICLAAGIIAYAIIQKLPRPFQVALAGKARRSVRSTA